MALTLWQQAKIDYANKMIPKLRGKPQYASLVAELEEAYEPLRTGADDRSSQTESNSPSEVGVGAAAGAECSLPVLPSVGAGGQAVSSISSSPDSGDGASDRAATGTCSSGTDEAAAADVTTWLEWRDWGHCWTYTGTACTDPNKMQTTKRPNVQFFPVGYDPNTQYEDF